MIDFCNINVFFFQSIYYIRVKLRQYFKKYVVFYMKVWYNINKLNNGGENNAKKDNGIFKGVER